MAIKNYIPMQWNRERETKTETKPNIMSLSKS